MTAEQPGETVYVVLEGSVKVHLEQPDGTEVILAVLGPGEVVEEMSLADSLGRSAIPWSGSYVLTVGQPSASIGRRAAPR